MALLKRKVQNACEKQPHGNELEFSLKNIVRNGEKVGCSGFVRNKETGLIVYLNTEDQPVFHFESAKEDEDEDLENDYEPFPNPEEE